MYFQLEKRVTLVVDGRPQAVRTFDSTVAEVLADAGISLGAHDEVTPAPQASLTEGLEIEVLLGKQITLVLNGTRREVWVTGGKTVAEVLELITYGPAGAPMSNPPAVSRWATATPSCSRRPSPSG